MEIRVNKVLLISTLLLTQSCSWFESKYDKLMNPIKKIKLAEKKAGKPNPVFDGVVEPDFPDEKENNKTLEGVDSNQDGVRDDIEIWINRTAEDADLRAALKEMYRKEIAFFQSLYNDKSEPIVHSHLSDYTALSGCVYIISHQYDEIYIKRHGYNAGRYYSEILDSLFANTSLRKKQESKWNGFQFKGSIGGDSDVECIKYPFGKRYLEVIEEYKKKTTK